MKYLAYSFLVVLMSASTLSAEPKEDYSGNFLTSMDSAECAQTIKNRVHELVPDRSIIRKYDFIARIGGGYGNSVPIGFEGWVSFRNCKGNLVIETNQNCQVRQSYTRGNCQINGVKHY